MWTVAANRIFAPFQTTRRTPNTKGAAIQDVCRYRCADIRVAEKFLNRSNVLPVREQMVANKWRNVWQLTRFEIPASRTVTTRCTTYSCR